ncbi:MAG: 50S ribosomal protein L15 [Candidatus Moeniiplasma glomeromycotorum]|nr:50S ribosomal protein L15 [Candidatus Moeniiplasma glomeromycotorum]MCE8163491.1 50S ribosomal protein L15 [Candidatus Moeniiplasma glomeromycotorum]MCE8166477.1 50S ribosomal protein L15 [Candidatus Moeniiplasma glomeromycotorum]MCE8166982.1 50S ribosomal protein L15 [Candidatus Moeniiplasma glomeromycotorum]MCE8168230.1 50S ribosomal protein L15 [Candidatus Moeniiplasma glomeromycotorum]
MVDVSNGLIKIVTPSKRVGRGIGSGRGKTAGGGQDGQKSRGRNKVPTDFEGGQTKISRRLPKFGSNKKYDKKEYQIINLKELNQKIKNFTGKTLDLSQKKMFVKILGGGELEPIKNSLTIKVNATSQSAQTQINQAGGKIEIVKKLAYDHSAKKKD